MAAVAQSLASHFSAKKRSQQQQESADERHNVAVVKAGGGSSSSGVFQFAFDVQDADTQQPSGKKKKKHKKKAKKQQDTNAHIDASVGAQLNPQVDVGGYIAVEDAGDLLAQLLMGAPKSGVKGKSHGAPSTKQASAPTPAAPKQQSNTTTTESATAATESTKKSKNSKKKKKAAKQQQESPTSSTTPATPTAPTSASTNSTKAKSKQQEAAAPSSSSSFLKLRKATGSESEIAKMQLRYGRGKRNLAAIAQREERKKKTVEQPSSPGADSSATASGPEKKSASGDAGATEFKFNFGT